MAQALKEIENRRTRYRVTDPGGGWDGVAYVRYFTCAKGDVAAYRASGAELADGAVLPVKWGGVATSYGYDPRLQEVIDEQPEVSAMALLRTVWISINVV